MSDNENVLDDRNWGRVDVEANLDDFVYENDEGSFRADLSNRKKFYLSSSAKAQEMEELMRIHNWASVVQHLLPLDESSLVEKPGPAWTPSELWKRAPGRNTPIRIEVLNLYSAVVSLSTNGWEFEHLIVLLFALTSAIAFSLAPTPNSIHLASQLDFHYLVTSLVYVVTFGSQQTLSRRDSALRILAAIKSLSCQMAIALLMWNRSRPRPTEDFNERIVALFQRGAYHSFASLTLPTWNRTRHYTTKSGLHFRRVMRRRSEHHRLGLVRFQCSLHEVFEEVKESNTIETHETTRLTDLARQLQVYSEQLQLVKEYRTTNIARSFVRCFLMVCPPMYGVYFSFIAGNLINGPATTELAFSLVLCISSLVLLMLLVNVERAMEDPCSTSYKGDRLDIAGEITDIYERLELIGQYCIQKTSETESTIRKDTNDTGDDLKEES